VRICHECEDAPVDEDLVEPIRDGSRRDWLCWDCLYALALDVAEGIWNLTHFCTDQRGDRRPIPTDDDRLRFLCAAFVSLNQRLPADAVAKMIGIKLPWRDDAGSTEQTEGEQTDAVPNT